MCVWLNRMMTAARGSILVVDDEEPIRELVRTVLHYEGFLVRTAASGQEAMRLLNEAPADLVVLDVMMPDLDGFEVQRRLRAAGHTVGVVFLTAKDSVADRVRGLAAGADDYLTKPFSLDELVARVDAVLRRTKGVAEPDVLVCADLEMNEALHEVRRSGQRLELTPTEYKLLRFLLRNGRQVVTRGQILDYVWEYDFGGESNIVESYMSYLRRKVDRGREPLIHTVRGVGYCLRPPDS
jgi:two-component system, OmpR family, response regulator